MNILRPVIRSVINLKQKKIYYHITEIFEDKKCHNLVIQDNQGKWVISDNGEYLRRYDRSNMLLNDSYYSYNDSFTTAYLMQSGHTLGFYLTQKSTKIAIRYYKGSTYHEIAYDYSLNTE